MPYKVIVVDLDGTIVNTNDIISPQTVASLTRASLAGVSIFVATGRSIFNAISVLTKYKLDKVVKIIIATNGSVIYDLVARKQIDSMAIDYALLKQIHQWTVDLKISLVLTPINASEPSYYVGDTPGQQEKDFFLNELVPISFVKLVKTPISSGIVIGKVEDVYKFADVLKARTDLHVAAGSPYSTQFSDSTKGDALKKVVTARNIDRSEVLVMGDSPNDISMFKIFPESVAMGNAFGGTKEYAKYTTDTIENEGVTQAIEKFIFAKTVRR